MCSFHVATRVPRCACPTRDGDRNWEPKPNRVFELPVENVPHDARTTGETDKLVLVSSLSVHPRHDDHDCKLRST